MFDYPTDNRNNKESKIIYFHICFASVNIYVGNFVLLDLIRIPDDKCHHLIMR